MTLSDPIQLRLKSDKQLFYQDESARLGKAMSVYLRERLEASDEAHEAIASLRCEVASLRLMLEDLGMPKSAPGNIEPTLLEILLLLRQICRPEHLKIAQGELNRLGLTLRTS